MIYVKGFKKSNRVVLTNTQYSRKWCIRLEFVTTLFVGWGGGQVCESAGTTNLLSYHFDGKQSRESVDLHSLANRLLGLPPLPSGRGRSGVSC